MGLDGETFQFSTPLENQQSFPKHSSSIKLVSAPPKSLLFFRHFLHISYLVITAWTFPSLILHWAFIAHNCSNHVLWKVWFGPFSLSLVVCVVWVGFLGERGTIRWEGWRRWSEWGIACHRSRSCPFQHMLSLAHANLQSCCSWV